MNIPVEQIEKMEYIIVEDAQLSSIDIPEKYKNWMLIAITEQGNLTKIWFVLPTKEVIKMRKMMERASQKM